MLEEDVRVFDVLIDDQLAAISIFLTAQELLVHARYEGLNQNLRPKTLPVGLYLLTL